MESLAIARGSHAFLASRSSTPVWLLIFTLPTLILRLKRARHPLPIDGCFLSGHRNFRPNNFCAHPTANKTAYFRMNSALLHTPGIVLKAANTFRLVNYSLKTGEESLTLKTREFAFAVPPKTKRVEILELESNTPRRGLQETLPVQMTIEFIRGVEKSLNAAWTAKSDPGIAKLDSGKPSSIRNELLARVTTQ